MASHTDIIRKFDTIIQSMRAGGVNNPIDYIEQISYFLFLKLLDEREEQAEQIAKLTKKAYDGVFAGDNEKYRFRNWAHSLNGDELRLFIESDIFPFIRNLKSLRPEEREYFRNAHLKIYEPSTLKGVVENIASMDFSSLDTIDKGDLYEHMLSQISKSGKNGQFRTPRHIIDMMTSIVDPDIMETVYDPSVGTAGFIISAFQHILKKYSDPATMKHKTDDRGVDYTLGTGDKLTETQSSFLYQKTFYGYDIDAHMVRFSIMNMILHGFTEGTNIRIKDTLGKNTDEQDKARQYDIILANPPFSGTIDRSRIDSDDFPVASNSTEVLFLGHMIDKLRDGGRAAVIVPEGVLFKTNNDYQAIRKYLMNKCTLQAVISLPSGVFNPYAGVKTNILVFQKGGKTDKVWFYDMHTDGYDLGAQRRPNKETDIPDILHRWKQIKQGKQLENDRSWCATKEEIEQNEWVLSASKYKGVVQTNKNQIYPYVKLGEVFKLSNGKFLPKKEQIDGVHRVYGGNGLSGFHNQYYLEEPTLIVGRVGEYCGVVHITVPRSWVTDNAMYVSEYKTEINQQYLFYILNKINLNQYANRAGQPSLSQSVIYEISIPLPPLDVQQELVNKLNAQQAIIDSIDTLITQLEEAGIDESLFDGIDEWVELGEVCELQNGYAFKSSELQKTKTEENMKMVVKIGNLSHGNHISVDGISWHIDNGSYSNYTVNKGDIMIAMTGATVGKVSYSHLNGLLLNQRVGLLKPRFEVVNRDYIWAILASNKFYDYCQKTAGGGAQGNISPTQILKYKIPKISLEKQMPFVDNILGQEKIMSDLMKLKVIRQNTIKNTLEGVFTSK